MALSPPGQRRERRGEANQIVSADQGLVKTFC